MGKLTVEYPENAAATFNQTRESFEQEAKMAMAAKLYELGRLTSGQAAKLAGMSRIGFLLECPNYGVPTVSWDQDEIEAEFDIP